MKFPNCIWTYFIFLYNCDEAITFTVYVSLAGPISFCHNSDLQELHTFTPAVQRSAENNNALSGYSLCLLR